MFTAVTALLEMRLHTEANWFSGYSQLSHPLKTAFKLSGFLLNFKLPLHRSTSLLDIRLCFVTVYLHYSGNNFLCWDLQLNDTY